MPIIDLDTAKMHLRIDGPDEDALLALYVAAAEDQALQFMGRNVYPDAVTAGAAILQGDLTAMSVNASVEAAVLLILGHLHANRENVVSGTIVTEMKQGAAALLAPYRVGLGV